MTHIKSFLYLDFGLFKNVIGAGKVKPYSLVELDPKFKHCISHKDVAEMSVQIETVYTSYFVREQLFLI